MNVKSSILILFFFAVTLGVASATGLEGIRDLEWSATPVHTLAVAEQQRFLTSFPFLFIEEEGTNLDYDDTRKFYNLILENDVEACLETDSAIARFCALYFQISRRDPAEKLDSLIEQGGMTGELALLGRSLSFMVGGNAAAATKLNERITSGSIRTYFKRYLGLYDPAGIIQTDPSDFSEYTRLYIAASRDVHLFNSNVSPDPYGYLDFLQGKLQFYKKNYELSANHFINAARNTAIREIALENAVRAFFNGRNFKKVREFLGSVKNTEFRRSVETMVKLENRKLNRIPAELLKEGLFAGYLLAHARESVLKGMSLNFLKGIDVSDVSEKLGFFICVAAIADRNTGKTADTCFSRVWEEKRYASLMSVLAEFINNVELSSAEEEAMKVMDEYRLYNYYPESYIYGQMSFMAGDHAKARRAYEIVLRNRREYTQPQLENVYYNLAAIYRDRGSYYTSVKLLEEALPQIRPEKVDFFRIEIIRLLVHKGDWDEALWRAEKLFDETTNLIYKKELQILLEICYENVDKYKSEEKQ